MPRLDHQAQEHEVLSRQERALFLWFLQHLNALRSRVSPPLPPLTRADAVAQVKTILRQVGD